VSVAVVLPTSIGPVNDVPPFVLRQVQILPFCVFVTATTTRLPSEAEYR
jgi:hypothetical protein